MTNDADGFRDDDRILVENWIGSLTGSLGRRLPDHHLERRLARITGRRPRLRDRLATVVRAWRRHRESSRAVTAPGPSDERPPATTSAPSKAAAGIPSIEEIAADLRRLDRQRQSPLAAQSPLWLAAVVRAYDERLRLCCRALGLDEHLEYLEGVDREIERIRIEGELQRCGVSVRVR